MYSQIRRPGRAKYGTTEAYSQCTRRSDGPAEPSMEQQKPIVNVLAFQTAPAEPSMELQDPVVNVRAYLTSDFRSALNHFQSTRTTETYCRCTHYSDTT